MRITSWYVGPQVVHRPLQRGPTLVRDRRLTGRPLVNGQVLEHAGQLALASPGGARRGLAAAAAALGGTVVADEVDDPVAGDRREPPAGRRPVGRVELPEPPPRLEVRVLHDVTDIGDAGDIGREVPPHVRLEPVCVAAQDRLEGGHVARLGAADLLVEVVPRPHATSRPFLPGRAWRGGARVHTRAYAVRSPGTTCCRACSVR
jgi:hypothetical protein